jgi:signal transduction histidine kinase
VAPPRSARRFLSRLRVNGLAYEDPLIERVLAYSRVFLALTCLVAWYLHSEGTSYTRLGLLIVIGYTIHSLALLLLLQFGHPEGRRFAIWSQVSDILWPALLCEFSDPSNSVFFVLFLFAILAVAYRWGFPETMATALICVALLIAQAVVFVGLRPDLLRLLFLESQRTRLVIRCGFLLMGGFLLGFLAETDKELRAEIALTNRLLSMAHVGTRFASALQQVLVEIGGVFDSERVETVCQSSTSRVFRWEPSLSSPAIAQVHEIAPAEYAMALMRGYPHTFYMKCSGGESACILVALDEKGQRLDPVKFKSLSMPVPGARSILVVGHEMGNDWTGRLVIVNPYVGWRRQRELRFAQDIMRQVAPALYSVYLFRRFRVRAGAAERARVARELHDTSIQSLISIEMQVDVLRRCAPSGPQLSRELEHIQDLLRDEVQNLRELMQTMRPLDLGPHQFLDFIAQLVERFSRDTGVAVRFVSELQEVTMPAATCRELARVVQEALVNVRKHSGAHTAVVRFGAQSGSWKLVIDDDGRGFPFDGRLDLAELDSYRRGPTVIKERVRTIGGDMVIESTPGHGSRIEITVPQKEYATYG